MFRALRREEGFYRNLAALTAPVVLQNIITTSQEKSGNKVLQTRERSSILETIKFCVEVFGYDRRDFRNIFLL